MTDPLRVGLVGAGPWAKQFHAPMLVRGPETTLAGVWARRPVAAAEIAHQFETTAYADYDDLLAHCDAVAFSVAPDAQPLLAIRAARAGRGLLLEKPLAGNLADAEELIAVIEETGVPSLVNLTYRFFENVRRFVTDAQAFEPFGGRFTFISGALVEGPFAFGWRLERGALLDLGPHVLDLAQATLGRITRVRAHGDPMRWVGLLVDHEGGRTSEISISGTTGLPAGKMKVDIELYGPKGELTLDVVSGSSGGVLKAVSTEFARICRERGAHELDARHGFEIQRWLAIAEADLTSA